MGKGCAGFGIKNGVFSRHEDNHQEMTNENIIRKIAALLARADQEQNDNEHEREIALRQANYLLAKHGLDIATLTKEQQEAAQGPMYESDDPIGRAIWKAGIYSSIAKLHNCTCIRSPQNQSIHVLGRKAMVDVARSIADWVIRSIEREMPIAWDAVKGKASINRRSFHTSFGNGASSAVSDTVDRILVDRKKGRIGDEQLSRSQALVLSNQDKRALQESEDYLKNLYPHLRSGSGSRSGSDKGYAAGRTFGASLSLHNQITRKGSVRRALKSSDMRLNGPKLRNR